MKKSAKDQRGGLKNMERSIVAAILIFMGATVVVGAVQAEDVMKDNSQLLVTFVELGSVNCIPCKMMQPVMKAIEKEYGNQVKVVFYDVWTQAGQPYAQKYQIRVIPTQVFLDKEGKEYFRHSGFFPREEIVKILKQQGVK